MNALEAPDGPAPAPIKVVICDDADDSARADWAGVEEEARRGGRPVVAAGWAKSAEAALSQATVRSADVFLVDLVMPVTQRGPDVIAGPWIARALTRAFEQNRRGTPPVIVLWTSNPMKVAGCDTHAFIELGGRDVIDKQDTYALQLGQLRALTDPDEQVRPRWAPPADGLAPHLRRLLPYLEEGLTSAEIGNVLFLAPRTVEGYRADLKLHLGVDGGGAGPIVDAARRAGISWVPLHYLRDPGENTPFSLAR